MRIQVRAGRIGGCNRALALHMFGVPEIDSTGKAVEKIYRDGELIEAEILNTLMLDGYKFTSGKVYKKKLKIDGFDILFTGTPDAMLKLKKGEYPVEIKSMNPWRYNRFPNDFSQWVDKLHEKYSYQMGSYVYITDSKCIYLIAGEKVKSHVNQVKIIKVLPSQLKQPEEILERIKIGLGLYKGEEVLPDSFKNCNFCSYCDSKEPWVKSPCAQSYVKPLSKIKKGDKEFLKIFKGKIKDIRQREEDLFELRTTLTRYTKMITIKYGKEVADEYFTNR